MKENLSLIKGTFFKKKDNVSENLNQFIINLEINKVEIDHKRSDLMVC